MPYHLEASTARRVERDACGIGFVTHTSGEARRDIVELALDGLGNMHHRGAIAADGLSGDGAGVLVAIPRAFFARVSQSELGATVDPDELGVVFAFLDADDPSARAAAEQAVVDACAAESIRVIGWRDVPVDPIQVGEQANAIMPAMRQAVIASHADANERERRAYRARRAAERTCADAGVRAYFASWSFRTVTYKALAISDRLRAFFPDLRADDFASSLAIFHSRFSTNTSPAWERAQPFRMLAHNGEINTLLGNERRMSARSELGTKAVGLGPESQFRPLFLADDSDSGKLDNALELLVRGGRDVRHAIAMLVPDAWEGQRSLSGPVRDFYRFHACLTDPWDGPAGLVFTDGRRVAAALDRNGLRPLRYQICADGLVVCASEVGAVSVAGRGAVQRGRLGPGDMLSVDPDAKEPVLGDRAVKQWLATQAPYGQWAADGLRPFPVGDVITEPRPSDELVAAQVAVGMTKEEIATVIKPMAADAKEPTFAMGDDTPYAALAARPRQVSHYLKQQFAQVTNPPIDHLRERVVMSLRTCLGPRSPILVEHPDAACLLELPSFFLYPRAVEKLLDPEVRPFDAQRLDATFPVANGSGGLRAAIERLAAEAEIAVRDGAGIVVISDQDADAANVPVPTLLVTGAVHQRLIAAQLRSRASIVVEGADARDTHSIAALIGFGADAVCPWLALETVAALADEEQLGELQSPEAQAKLQAALEDGVLKILSKMGISTVDGYRSAQIFEVLGLGADVVDLCFTGCNAPVGGVSFEQLADEILGWHEEAFEDDVALAEPGYVRHRKRGGEYHDNNPTVIDKLHAFTMPDEEVVPVGDAAELRAAHLLNLAIEAGQRELYDAFADEVRARPVTTLGDLLEWVPAGEPIPLDQVEPASAITKRFSTGAMSHGALSKEAHETLAAAMNLIGGASNCGEGGEDPHRYRTRGDARDLNSRIKQIASGRFGVTPEYLAFADELNIKMAQGSKPGEGGQLPGHKVSAEIARLRHTQPGVGLISPPPHHDIYSIEDLAQLIFDLKQVNQFAAVSVKLVAELGVGQISTGVVKALADVVQISGANGGTGASPLSSIKHAGMPWEYGLADAQRALVDEGLRSRVRVRVDGGFKTGRDIVLAALLGADEYSFGTAVMLAEGCIMLRACHRDTCSTGVATQRPNLRAKFRGTPEGVARYLLFVAEETREILASLGLRSVDDAIGRVELLRQRVTGDARADAFDVTHLLAPPSDADAPRRFVAHVPIQRPRSALDEQLLLDGYWPLYEGDDSEFEYTITNADRTVGASLGGAVGLEFGGRLPPGSVHARFAGVAGQSFGAFLSNGVTLELHGEANDYVGKGMGGGCIIIRPPDDDAGDPVLMGNTVLYGATGGEVFVAGAAGERFCVRNSGATVVVEGTGDHACEYMTGGTAVILGEVGANLGAGMTGGQAYVYDPHGQLVERMNRQLVDAISLDDEHAVELRYLVERHVHLTGSERARVLLDLWESELAHFWRVVPISEVQRIERANEGVLTSAR
ncbi:MAG: glutamate synthase-related protein [Acidimicrobiia bacterium]